MRFPRLVLGAAAASALVAAWLAPCPPAHAFKASIHADLTEEALESPALTRTAGGETFTFGSRAVFEVQSWNVQVDVGPAALNPVAHFDDERLADGSTRLRNLRQRIVALLTQSAPDGASARRLLGGALHTLQDFYSHSNWVEQGRTSTHAALGTSVLPDPLPTDAVCGPDRATLTDLAQSQLTTGYFDLEDPCGAAPEGKCLHGSSSCAGIHKDDESRAGFAQARSLALQATVGFVASILDAPGVSGNRRALRALMGTGGTFGIVLDDSLSMDTEVGAIKTAVSSIVSTITGTASGPDEFLLLRFGPTIGGVHRTSDPAAFLAQVNAVQVQGGAGDGAEPTQTALYRAVAAARPGSTIYLVTDADASDPGVAANVNALARSKGIRIVAVLTGAAAQGDPVYASNAALTGGERLVVADADAGKGLDLANDHVAGDVDAVLLAEGVLGTPARQFLVPIDGAATRAVFTGTLASKTAVHVRRPSGETVVAGPGVTITDFAGGTVVRVDAPESGTWRLVVEGTGAYTASAVVTSPVDVAAASFVSRRNAAHPGLFDVSGEPVLGEAATLSVRMLGPVSDLAFEAVDRTGMRIQGFDLAQGTDPDAGSRRFVGAVTVPAVPFRVVATGTAGGTPFRRVFPTLFEGQAAEVTLDDATRTTFVAAGRTTTLRFRVRNADAAERTFRIAAEDDQGFVTQVTPSSLTLGAGQTGTVDVDVAVPGAAPAGDLSVTLAADGGAGARNTATFGVPVIRGTTTVTLDQGLLRDAPKAGRDQVTLRGRVALTEDSPQGRFDPATESLVVEVGGEGGRLTITIPAGDPRWRLQKRGRLLWSNGRGDPMRVKLEYAAEEGRFTLQASRFDFPAAQANPIRVSVQAGDDGGIVERDWTVRRGVFRLPR